MGSARAALAGIRERLEGELREYLTEFQQWRFLYDEWNRVHRLAGFKPPGRPSIALPAEVVLYQEMKHWGVLLVKGGLMDQPSWTWEIVNMAGMLWESLLAGELDVEEMMGEDDDD